jgi:DNA-binding GntR family transcriptional regulator
MGRLIMRFAVYLPNCMRVAGGHSAAGAHTNRRLVELIVARERDRAEAHRRRHMENAGIALLRGYDKLKVREIMS